MERIPEFIGNHLFLVTLFVSILMLLAWNVSGSAFGGIVQLAPAEATFLVNREHAVLVDVRPPEDFKAGHVLNAINVPEQELPAALGKFEKQKARPMIAVCQNGAASARAARVFKQAGFEKVHSLKGGMSAWQSAGLPVSREEQKED